MKITDILLKLVKTSFLTVFIILSFTACENLFEGANYKQQVEDYLNELNAPEVNLKIQVDEIDGTYPGTSTPSGEVKFKINKEVDLRFKIDKEFSFLYWKVIDEKTNTEIDSSYISIADKNNYETTFTIKKELGSNVKAVIKPVCEKRPQSKESYPPYENAGVAYDTLVEFKFSHNMDKMSFYFTEEEIAALDNVQNYFYLKDNDDNFLDIDYNVISDPVTDSAKKVIYGYIDNEEKAYFKNIEITNKAGFSVAQYYLNPRVEQGKILHITPDSYNVVPLQSDGYEVITIAISPDVCNENGIPLGSFAPSLTYKINNSTTETLDPIKINITVDDPVNGSYMGTISPAVSETVGYNEYDVGSIFKIKFTESAGYRFNKWSVVYADDKTPCTTVLLADASMSETTVIVNKHLKNYEGKIINIIPECDERPSIKSSSPEYNDNGVDKDTPVEIVFSQMIDKNYFFYSATDLNFINWDGKGSNNEGLLRNVNGDAYGYRLNGFVYFKNLNISSLTGESYNKYYHNLEYSVVKDEGNNDCCKIMLYAKRDNLIPVESGVTAVVVTVSKDIQNEEGVSFGSSDPKFIFNVNENKDVEPPKDIHILLKNNPESEEQYYEPSSKLNAEAYNKYYTDKYRTKSFYIDCIGSDNRSGIYAVNVKETRVITGDGAEVQVPLKSVTYKAGEGCFPFTSDGVSKACFEYTINSTETGLYKFEFEVLDFAGNAVKYKSPYYFFVDRSIELEGLKVFNSISPASFKMSNGKYLSKSDFSLTEEKLNEASRTIKWTEAYKIWGINPNYYDASGSAPDENMYGIEKFDICNLTWSKLESDGTITELFTDSITKNASNYRQTGGKNIGLWNYTIPEEYFQKGNDYIFTISCTDKGGNVCKKENYLSTREVALTNFEFTVDQIESDQNQTGEGGDNIISVPRYSIYPDVEKNFETNIDYNYSSPSESYGSYYGYKLYEKTEGSSTLKYIGYFGDTVISLLEDPEHNSFVKYIPSEKNSSNKYKNTTIYAQLCYYSTNAVEKSFNADFFKTIDNTNDVLGTDTENLYALTDYTFDNAVVEQDIAVPFYEWVDFDSCLNGPVVEILTVEPEKNIENFNSDIDLTTDLNVSLSNIKINVKDYKSTGKCGVNLEYTGDFDTDKFNYLLSLYSAQEIDYGFEEKYVVIDEIQTDKITTQVYPNNGKAAVSVVLPCTGEVSRRFIWEFTATSKKSNKAIIIPARENHYFALSPSQSVVDKVYDTTPPDVMIREESSDNSNLEIFVLKENDTSLITDTKNYTNKVIVYWEANEMAVDYTADEIRALGNKKEITYQFNNPEYSREMSLNLSTDYFQPNKNYNIYVEVQDAEGNLFIGRAGRYLKERAEFTDVKVENLNVSYEEWSKANAIINKYDEAVESLKNRYSDLEKRLNDNTESVDEVRKIVMEWVDSNLPQSPSKHDYLLNSMKTGTPFIKVTYTIPEGYSDVDIYSVSKMLSGSNYFDEVYEQEAKYIVYKVKNSTTTYTQEQYESMNPATRPEIGSVICSIYPVIDIHPYKNGNGLGTVTGYNNDDGDVVGNINEMDISKYNIEISDEFENIPLSYENVIIYNYIVKKYEVELSQDSAFYKISASAIVTAGDNYSTTSIKDAYAFLNNFEAEQTCLVKNIFEGYGGYTILSDNLYFVHTMSSSENYGSDISRWEAQGFETGFIVSSINQNYQINYDAISKGDYYIVIVHFMDGTVLATPVKQNQ